MSNSYQKSSGKQEFRKPIAVVMETETPREAAIGKVVSPAYTKGEGTLDPSLFIIVSGGEVRERDYFNFFKNRRRSFPRIVVEFIDKNQRGVGGLGVAQLVEVALQVKQQKEESKSDDVLDSINIVTDLDHFYPEIIANLPVCKANNVELIISNPCFEIWLYYSYYRERPDFVVPEDESKISSGFKKYLGDKHKGGVDPRKAPFSIAGAIENSAANYLLDERGIPILFSTQMHLLASKLYELTKEGIEKERQAVEQRREKYMRGK